MMRLFGICIIVCAVQCDESSPDELLEFANAKAQVYLAEEAADLENVLHVSLFHGTCYTNRYLNCISKPPVRARFGVDLNIPRPPSHIIESYTEAVPYSETGFPIAKTADLPTFARHFTAFVMDESDTTTVAAGVTLRTAVENCKSKGAYFEAFVRIMNAVESAGISAISRFCSLSVKLMKIRSKMDELYDNFDRLLDVMQTRFERIFISTEPICEIRAALHVVQGLGVEASAVKKHIFFTTTCQEFSCRYHNMVGYAMAAEYNDMDNEHLAKPIKKELYSNILNAHNFFLSIADGVKNNPTV